MVKTSDDDGEDVLTDVLGLKHVLSLEVLAFGAGEFNVLVFESDICGFAQIG